MITLTEADGEEAALVNCVCNPDSTASDCHAYSPTPVPKYLVNSSCFLGI